MFVVNGSPFLNQDRVAHWDMCLEFETGRKVYTHRFLYEDWQVSGVTNDRLKCQVQARQEC